MKLIEDNPKKKYTLNSAKINGYTYKKYYYKIYLGEVQKTRTGNDSCFTVIKISKKDSVNKSKESFILSEGYVGAEKSYKENGDKRTSLSKKSAFGMSFLIDYINI